MLAVKVKYGSVELRKIGLSAYFHVFVFPFGHFQGGAEHNVPVVISKIFKDQVGK